MIGYDFHPEARLDLDEIWEFIRVDSLEAADRLIAEILDAMHWTSIMSITTETGN